MNKIKFISLAAGIALALAFTVSCSSNDDDDSPPSSSSDAGTISSSSSLVTPSGSSSSGGGSQSSSSGGGGYNGSYGFVTHGNQNYKTVVIGTQTWMAENLNYDAEGSKCVYDDPSNCAEYGRLYDWSTAMALDASCNEEKCSEQIDTSHQGICPEGWHIPSNAEWGELFSYVDEQNGGGSPYGSTAGKYLKATTGWSKEYLDTYGFSALPSGYYAPDDFGDYGFYSVGDRGYWWSASEGEEYDDSAYAPTMGNDDIVAVGPDGKSALFSVRCMKD